MTGNLLHIVLSLSLAQPFTLTSTNACEGPPSEACEKALADSYDRLSLDCLHALTEEVIPPDLTKDDALHLQVEPPSWLLIVFTGVVTAAAGFGLGYLVFH